MKGERGKGELTVFVKILFSAFSQVLIRTRTGLERQIIKTPIKEDSC